MFVVRGFRKDYNKLSGKDEDNFKEIAKDFDFSRNSLFNVYQNRCEIYIETNFDLSGFGEGPITDEVRNSIDTSFINQVSALGEKSKEYSLVSVVPSEIIEGRLKASDLIIPTKIQYKDKKINNIFNDDKIFRGVLKLSDNGTEPVSFSDNFTSVLRNPEYPGLINMSHFFLPVEKTLPENEVRTMECLESSLILGIMKASEDIHRYLWKF